MTTRYESAEPIEPEDDAPATRPRDLVPPNPYAIPLSTLVAGAYVGVAEQVQLHPSSSPRDDIGAGFGGEFGAGGGVDGDSD